MGNGAWDVELIRNLNDWEVNKYINLFQYLSEQEMPKEALDEPFWKLNSKGAFTVKSYSVPGEEQNNEGEFPMETDLENKSFI